MGACLRAWSSWLSGIADRLSERQSGTADTEVRDDSTAWAKKCRRLGRRLASMAREAPFAEAGEDVAHLRLSSLFRNDPTYHRFYRLWQDMNLGLSSVFGDFLNMPIARTFELYELWCFLRLVRASVEEFGPGDTSSAELFVADAAGGVTIAAGAVTFAVGDGWKVCFQKSYKEFWLEPTGQGSFSRYMTPDVVLAQDVPSERRPVIVLDAKYRIGQGLSDALTSIHTYRDALVREAESGAVEGLVAAAYILTPYIPDLKTTYRDTRIPDRLFHAEYRSHFRFGAVTMRPGMTLQEVVLTLRTILADAQSSGQ